MITSAKKQAQNLSKKIARQMVQEPLEVLKSARGQLSGEQINYYQERIAKEAEQKSDGTNKQDLASKDKVQSSRALQALERELQDIRVDRLFKELQRKIAEGEEVYLEDIPELTPEQKQVLLAQKEAVKAQKEQMSQGKPLAEPKTRTKRGSWMFGGKSQAQKQQTHVEKPLPPSG
ncbi:hypothetical protein HY502_01930 [Candidatus Woesebacteria bacterium]|nr:hypothetical protein [Candidatus Woesebacteria bacterium]